MKFETLKILAENIKLSTLTNEEESIQLQEK
jgi:hypothetical protein